MQIFASSSNPHKCAQVLDDKRVNKMIMESSQLLSAALFLQSPDKNTRRQMLQWKLMHRIHSNIYKKDGDPVNHPEYPAGPGWHNHPLAKWTAKSQSNYRWLLRHLIWLLYEYTIRSEKDHAYDNHVGFYTKFIQLMPQGDQTPFLNCTTLKDYTDDIHQIYRDYLTFKWTEASKGNTKWSNRCPPQWFLDNYEVVHEANQWTYLVS